jgi:toxin HigB-1
VAEIEKSSVAALRQSSYCAMYLAAVHWFMIGSFKENWLEAYFHRNRHDKRIPADIDARLFRKLQLIDDATTDADLRVPPGNHFERLNGPLAEYHSIRINQQWRLIFRWNAATGEAQDIYLDNHSYR